MDGALGVVVPMTTRVGDTPLEDRAMIARLHIRLPTFRKTDKKISREVAEQKGSDAAMHTHHRRTLAKKALEDIQKVVSAARTYHNEHTSPWEDDGERILTAMLYEEYMEKEREYERAYAAAVAAFIPNYPAHMEEAKALLGDTYNEKDYPNPLRIAEKFGFEIRISKVSTDFRCGSLTAEDQSRIQQEIETRTQQALTGVTHDLFEQMFEHVEHMVDRLTLYNEREEKNKDDLARGEGTFKDSLVNNLKEFIERLPKMNLTGDSKIEDLRLRCLRTLCAHTPEDLRKSPLTRQHVLGQAKAIREAVSELI